MFSLFRNAQSHSMKCSSAAVIEALELRQLLSSSVEGYSPAEIRHAYEFDQVHFGTGRVKANGAGQTIAIVDAYNDPNIVKDVKVFDSKFDLPACKLRVVNQSGGRTLPATDAGWASEIALDVEWAHAIAPGAKILLVEANSDSTSDLIAAADYARHVAGVSVVSMSWGGSELFKWGGGEDAGETSYDQYFTTPDGHQGVTFVASSGDSGTVGGVMWPSASPNVLSVGGTSLALDSSGNYDSESSWAGSGGGNSLYENKPSYQENAQSSGSRSAPDVAYNGDPNTGFAVYNSVEYQGNSGWQSVGGTSAGAPQWAALVSIADQGRKRSGKGTLDGPNQTLPALYGLYASPDSTGYPTYTTYFNDTVETGSDGDVEWPFGGLGRSYPASTGYDLVTGLGTPKAVNLINALVDSVGRGGGSGSGTGNNAGSGSPDARRHPTSPFDDDPSTPAPPHRPRRPRPKPSGPPHP